MISAMNVEYNGLYARLAAVLDDRIGRIEVANDGQLFPLGMCTTL